MNLVHSSYNLLKLLDNLPNHFIKKNTNEPNTLLLTGATGFLGIHLLYQLVLENNYKKIYIIVRNKQKLHDQIAYYCIPEFSFDNIVIIEGDLKTIPENSFPNVSHVIHSAAIIHCIKPLTNLWNDNVLITHKICDIYKQSALIYFISTLSVFVSSNQYGEHYPTSLPEREDYCLFGGYAQSKYLAEKIVERVNGKIIRLGLLTGSTFAGVFPPNDFFTQIVENLSSLNCYPQNYEEAFVDLTPVDLCAQNIVNFLKKSQKLSSQFLHIANKNSVALSDFISIMKLNPIEQHLFTQLLSKRTSLTNTLLNYAFFKTTMLKTHFKFFNIDLFQSTNHNYGIEKEFNVSNTILLKLYIDTILQQKIL